MPTAPRSHESRQRDTRWGKKKAEQYHKDQSGKARAIRATGRWKKLAGLKKKRNPICEDPFGHHAEDQRPEPMRDVHHIVPIEEDESKAFVWSNLMSVCRACHAKLDKGKE